MAVRILPPLGITVQDPMTLVVPSPDATPLHLTGQEIASLPARIPLHLSSSLIPANGLEVRYTGLWHGLLASGDRPPLPTTAGFHPGTTPAFPKQLLIHPDVRYLRDKAFYFPFLRRGDHFFLLRIPYQNRFHTPLLISIDGLIVPYTYVSLDCPEGTAFPGNPARLGSLR